MARPLLASAPMSAHEQALQRLRTLLVAQNALAVAVEEATQEVLRTAAEEGTVALVESQRVPVESGVHRRVDLPTAADHERATRHVMRRIGSADVERYIAEKWRSAESDNERARVRAMVESSARNGSLDDASATRMRELTTEALAG